MDITAGKGRFIHYRDKLVECPLYGGMPMMISLNECGVCGWHRGIEKTTEIEGIEIFDVLCGLPSRRRVSHFVTEVKDDSAE